MGLSSMPQTPKETPFVCVIRTHFQHTKFQAYTPKKSVKLFIPEGKAMADG